MCVCVCHEAGAPFFSFPLKKILFNIILNKNISYKYIKISKTDFYRF